jgi:hypothetical protein
MVPDARKLTRKKYSNIDSNSNSIPPNAPIPHVPMMMEDAGGGGMDRYTSQQQQGQDMTRGREREKAGRRLSKLRNDF